MDFPLPCVCPTRVHPIHGTSVFWGTSVFVFRGIKFRVSLMELPLAAFLWHQIGACALLFSTLLYSFHLFSSLFYSYLLLSFLLCSILLFCALLCSSVFFSSPLSCTLYSFLACSSQLFSSLPHPTLPYSSPLSSTLLYSTLPYWGSEMRAKYWTYQAAEKCPR